MVESTKAEEIAMALGAALVRKGLLDASDLADAADGAERDGMLETAHALRVIAIEGSAPTPSAWEAEKRRGQMRVVRD